ncbi:MAG: hypothetical protein WC260_02620 [Candidatus Pacearchaeota archaeon]
MKKFVILFFILLIDFCLAIEIENINCPKEVNTNEEFYCTLDLIEVNGLYDLKFNVYSEGLPNLNKVWNGNDWQRSDWYIQKLISKNGEYKILSKIDKNYEGIATISIRLRENKATSFSEKILEIKINNMEEEIEDYDETEINNLNEIVEEGGGDIEEENIKEENIEKKEIIKENKIISKSIINLNSNNNTEELIYKSKSKQILRVIPYILTIFLIALISFIIIKR